MNNPNNKREFFNALYTLSTTIPTRYFTDWNRMITILEENQLVGICSEQYLDVLSFGKMISINPYEDGFDKSYPSIQKETDVDPTFLRYMFQFLKTIYKIKQLTNDSVSEFTGIGTYRTDTYEYTGEFFNGCFEGYGCLKYDFNRESDEQNMDELEQTNQLIGVFSHNRYVGHPIILNNMFEDIPWKPGVLFYSGKGTFQYADKSRYEGDLECCMPMGKGLIFFQNGDTYSGDVKSDILDGIGILKTTEGNVYSGAFIQSSYTDIIKEGQPTPRISKLSIRISDEEEASDKEKDVDFTFSDGSTYVGEIDNDMPNGKGIIRHANGNIYSGEVVDGQYEGNGTLKMSNGNIFTGIFSESEFINGEILYSNGSVYKGECLNNVPDGFGIYRYKMGTKTLTRQGLFEKGFFIRSNYNSFRRRLHQHYWDFEKGNIVVVVKGEFKGMMGRITDFYLPAEEVTVRSFETLEYETVMTKDIRLLDRIYPKDSIVEITGSGVRGRVVSYDFDAGRINVETENYTVLSLRPDEIRFVPEKYSI